MTLKLEGQFSCNRVRSRGRFSRLFDVISDDGQLGVSAGPTAKPSRAAAWRGGCFNANRGLLVAWVGRFVRIDDHSQSSASCLDGYSFAERLSAAYTEWSQDVLRRLKGEFAICIWDPYEAVLRLVSDPLRSVPFYYCVDSNGDVQFGNHVGRLARSAAASPHLDLDWMLAAIKGASIAEPNATCLEAVRAVPGGSVVEVTRSNIRIRRYWRPTCSATRTQESLVNDYRQRLFDRVSDALDGAGPAAVALSGGLDSSSLIGIAQKLAPDKVLAITNHIPNVVDSDELSFAREAVAGSGVSLRIENPSAAPCTLDLLEAACEPGPAEWFPFIKAVADSARESGCGVLATGVAGDVLGGFDGGWPAQYASESRWTAIFQDLYQGNMESGSRAAVQIARSWAGTFAPRVIEAYRVARMHFQAAVEGTTVISKPVRESRAITQKEYGWSRLWNSIDSPFAVLIEQYVDSELAAMNRLSSLIHATTGILLVHPFLDPEILQIAAVVPWSLRHGREGGRQLLRRAMEGILPERIRLRRDKCRYNVFYERYFANSLEMTHFREGGRRLEFLLNRPWDKLLESAGKEAPYRDLAPIFRVGLIGAWLHAHGLTG